MGAEYLSETSVAEFFDTSTTTVRRWVKAGAIPQPIVIGGSKRWHIDGLRSAAGRAIDGSATRGARSADPDEMMHRKMRDVEKARKSASR